ncbi:uncharacterized protein YjiK [Sinobacterium caligoides]|uniref:Uncharacterized protein YjiK n=2 Tax=Sinobacterium caligoides TaxID=933926 RepID=A0A3N2DMS9_9GAMM|nr:uncharacterized protein YjiK [Sinobacterium caligoides]
MMATVLYAYNVDDRLLSITQELMADDSEISLERYGSMVDGHAIAGIEDNLSGVTYDSDSGHLWVVINAPTKILELDEEFKVVRSIELEGFCDTEAIAYAGHGRFVVAEERQQAINLIEVHDDTEVVNKEQVKSFTLNTGGCNNKGWEGLAVVRDTGTIYVARENNPMKILKIDGFLTDENIVVDDLRDLEMVDHMDMDDFSGMHYNPVSKTLMVLSDDSKLLAEIDKTGHLLSYKQLDPNLDLTDDVMLQPEGVASDDKGYLYVVSEPNMVYRYLDQAHREKS